MIARFNLRSLRDLIQNYYVIIQDNYALLQDHYMIIQDHYMIIQDNYALIQVKIKISTTNDVVEISIREWQVLAFNCQS